LQPRNASGQPLFRPQAGVRAVPIQKKRSRPANFRNPQLRELQRAL
jgi:hypothetical protein